jgi:hypothetical protein
MESGGVAAGRCRTVTYQNCNVEIPQNSPPGERMAMEPMNVDDLLALAQKAGFSNDAENQAGLPPQLQVLHRAALRAFLDQNGTPTRRWFREQALRLSVDPDEALARLADVDLVHVDTERLSVAYPFSGAPTRHRVQLAKGQTVWAMCAIDALGVLEMTGEDGTVTSSDPDTNTPIRAERHQDEWMWEPQRTVVAIGLTETRGTSAELLCPQIDFHTDPGCAESHLIRSAGSAGYVLDQPTAVELADRGFGPLLSR